MGGEVTVKSYANVRAHIIYPRGMVRAHRGKHVRVYKEGLFRLKPLESSPVSRYLGVAPARQGEEVRDLILPQGDRFLSPKIALAHLRPTAARMKDTLLFYIIRICKLSFFSW